MKDPQYRYSLSLYLSLNISWSLSREVHNHLLLHCAFRALVWLCRVYFSRPRLCVRAAGFQHFAVTKSAAGISPYTSTFIFSGVHVYNESLEVESLGEKIREPVVVVGSAKLPPGSLEPVYIPIVSDECTCLHSLENKVLSCFSIFLTIW